MAAKLEKVPKVTFLEINSARVGGRTSKRALVTITAHRPCGYALRDKPAKPCKFCAFWKGSPMVDGEPFEKAVSKAVEAGAKRIELLPGGSMLDQRQIRIEELEHMLDFLAKLPIESVFMPSRPEFVDARLKDYVRRLGRIKLEIGIGLETSDDSLRESLGKGFTTHDYLIAVRSIVEAGALPVTFVLTGLAMSKKNALADLMETGRRISKLQGEFGVPFRIALEPYFKTKLTSVEAGAYMTPGFIAEAAIRLVRDFGLDVFIATSGEGHVVHPLNAVRTQIEQFNLTQDVRILASMIGDAEVTK